MKKGHRHLSLIERWHEENELNKKIGIYNTKSQTQKIPKARKVNNNELNRILEKLEEGELSEKSRN